MQENGMLRDDQAPCRTELHAHLFDTYPTEWDKVKAAPFPQLGFTHCWETCPVGINGRSVYLRLDYIL